MHEIGIAQEVLRIIEGQARGHGPGAVRSAQLSIGQLSGVVPESLEFALEVCARGTRAEGMKIVVRRVPARGLCKSCGHQWDFAPGQMECPACRQSDIRLDGGDDLTVDSFEMEDSSEPPRHQGAKNE